MIRQQRTGRRLETVVVLGLFLSILACASVGREFAVTSVPRIKIGETTQAEVRTMFGEPWRTGLEDGDRTWTYARYKYALFSSAKTTDLVVQFDEKGVVTSYTFNTTEYTEKDLKPPAEDG